MVQRIAELKRVLEQLEEQTLVNQHTASKKQAEISYLGSKAAEYKETLRNSRQVSFDSDGLDHPSLLSDSSRYPYYYNYTSDNIIILLIIILFVFIFYYISHIVCYCSLTQLQTLTTQVNEVLTSYMDLPPDIAMAKLKIEEAKSKLTLLEETLSAKLGGIM